ncbi:MAG: hypothetical protein J6T23_03555 [Elusimicrobia bacterium]|nr:hypothetical protein [Elusimicrobiota bacterium]
MSNGEMIAKKPKNNYVSNGNINFDGIINGVKEREKEKSEKFYKDMQEKAAAERERNEEITNLFKKAYDKQQETRKKKMQDEQKAAEEKALKEVREKYRAESPQEWNESEKDKAYKTLLTDLNKNSYKNFGN